MEMVLMALLGAASILGLFGSSDTSQDDTDEVAAPEQTDEPETTTDPEVIDEQAEQTPDPVLEEPPVVDVTFTENTDGSYSAALGEGETGSLLALKFEQTADGENFDRVFSLGLFGLPEGVDVPIVPTGLDLDYTSVEGMISSLGLTEVARFDLGTLGDPFNGDGEDNRIEAPVITSDDPIDIIRVRYGFGDGGEPFFNTEPDETLSPFEEAGVYFNGVERIIVDEDFTGTDGTDFILAQGEDPVRLQGFGGRDVFISDVVQSTLEGGAGDDSLYAPGDQSTVSGGEGDDTIAVGPNGMAFGGTGNDNLSSLAGSELFAFNETEIDMAGAPADNGTEMFGGAGDDTFDVRGAQVVGYGGEGDDRFRLTEDGTAFGEAGDDFFNLGEGTTADGGAGNDSFQMVATIDNTDPTTVVTGGDGVDTYEFLVRNPFGSESALALRITDFEPGTDMLNIEEWSPGTFDDMRIEEAADGSYTDIIADFSDRSDGRPGTGTTTAIIRLDGVSGFSLNQLVSPLA